MITKSPQNHTDTVENADFSIQITTKNHHLHTAIHQSDTVKVDVPVGSGRVATILH